MQAEQADYDPGHISEFGEMVDDKGADQGGTGAKGDENECEAQHERDRRKNHPAPLAGVIIFTRQFVETDPCKETQIGWHQRQDAGRCEGNQPCQKSTGPGDGEVHVFLRLAPSSRPRRLKHIHIL